MGNLDIIDQFMQTFVRYIDSGFGLLNGDVAFLTTILVGLDVTLAGLFWAMDGDGNLMPRLIKKTLYVGTFAFILNNFSRLATILFDSFAGLGLHVTNNALTAQDLLRPGRLAAIGFQAAWPLLQQASSLMGFTSVFNHIVTILVLVGAWFIVVLAFFILAVQLFITILEFKLTTLAGFVLVPFALWNKTTFLAERVLGNVIGAGVKVMVLAVVVGIGAGFFTDFITALQGQEPTLAQAMSLVLASIALFGLGIFGPGIATGLVSGAPQLGAGTAVGTAGALAAGGFATSTVAGAAAVGGLGAIRAATAMGSGVSTAYSLGQASAGARGGTGAGLVGIARAGAGLAGEAARAAARRAAAPIRESVAAGRNAAGRATGRAGSPAPSSDTPETINPVPHWARRLDRDQRARAHRHVANEAIRDGNRPGTGAHPTLDDRDH